MAETLESQLELISGQLAQKRSKEALQGAENALERWPDSGRLVMLYGIALGQAGRVDEAAAELRRATMLAPDDPETFYNHAVQLLDMGDAREAALQAREALRLDPNLLGAAELIAKCDAAPGSAEFEAIDELVTPGRKDIRTGPDNPPQPVWNLGPAWTAVGYGLLALCAFSTVLIVVHPPVTHGAIGVPRRDPLSVLAIFLWPFTGFGCLFWVIADLIDRRDRFVWMIPFWLCGLVDIPILPLAIYLFFVRKATVMRSA